MIDCKHEKKHLKNLENSTFCWCTLCGTLIQHVHIGGVFKQVSGGIYCNFDEQQEVIWYCDKHNYKSKKHEHDWFRLTKDYKWCRTCGSLGIKTMLFPNKLQLVERKGILFPKKLQARLSILKEANLLQELYA